MGYIIWIYLEHARGDTKKCSGETLRASLSVIVNYVIAE